MSHSSNVRVRFAPSPTGYLHVGGVRTLLFNWLYARKTGGKLILRIEDTDQARSTPENERMMMADIRKLDFDYDEGPDVGGDYGPYRQSERMHLYSKHVRQLLDEDKAFHCFCTSEEIGQKRELALKMGKPPVYDGTCRRLTREQAELRIKNGDKAGVRFKAHGDNVVLEDAVRGTVTFQGGTTGDFMIARTPTEEEALRIQKSGESELGIGMPVYNFACVIDDALMKMTHILRGEDHLSNTAKQLMLYDTFGFKRPVFAHMPMVLGADRQKLSKRNGDVSTKDYLDKGYLPDTLLNFLALLGWWPSSEVKPSSGHPEVLSRKELTEAFELSGIQKSPAVFDHTKLDWMNGFYIRMKPLEEIANLARPFFERDSGLKAVLESHDSAWYLQVIDAVRANATLLGDLPGLAMLFFESEPLLEDAAREILAKEGADKVVVALEKALAQQPEIITPEAVGVIQKQVSTETGAKGKMLFMPMRVAVSGRLHGPELNRIIPLLGKSGVLRNVAHAKQQMGL